LFNFVEALRVNLTIPSSFAANNGNKTDTRPGTATADYPRSHCCAAGDFGDSITWNFEGEICTRRVYHSEPLDHLIFVRICLTLKKCF